MSPRIRGGYELGLEAARGGIHVGYDADGRKVAARRIADARHAIETRVLQALDHPRIVRVFGLVDDPSGCYLITEWVDGIDLAELLRRDGAPGLPADRVLQWTLQAADGLAYVHEQQTVHRDVQPRNLMLTEERGIVVLDFGLARGTPGFMAPEAREGGPITARSDVYGLAATAWTLIGGSPPSLGAREELPGATPHLVAALRRALAIDPRERTPTMAGLAASLGGRIHLDDGRDMAVSVRSGPLLQGVVRTAAGVFDAAATTLALARPGGELLFVAAWGAGADALVGRTLAAGTGIAGRAIARRAPELIADVQTDPDFAGALAARIGYEPAMAMIVPLIDVDGRTVGALSILDRRDGTPYDLADLTRARLFAELAVDALTAHAESASTDTYTPTTVDAG